MGAKNKHWTLSAYDTPIYVLDKGCIQSHVGSHSQPLSESLQVLEAAHISPCCSATELALTPATCPPQAVLSPGRVSSLAQGGHSSQESPGHVAKMGHQCTGSAERGELCKPAAMAEQEAPAGDNAACRHSQQKKMRGPQPGGS